MVLYLKSLGDYPFYSLYITVIVTVDHITDYTCETESLG